MSAVDLKSSDAPTVIHTYRTKCTTVDLPPGFGDFLRGSLTLGVLSQEMGFRLVLDFSQHPIGRFLTSASRVGSAAQSGAGDVHEFFNDRAELLDDHLQALQPGETTYVTTHKFAGPEGIPRDVCRKVADQLKFNVGIEELVRARLPDSDQGGYAVLHVRVPDQRMLTEDFRESAVSRLSSYVNDELVSTWGKRILVLSNNSSIQRMVAKDAALANIETTSIHLGECNEEEAVYGVRDTLVDFVLMSRAAKIYSCSHYRWQSGFSRQCAEIYGIPFVDIRGTVNVSFAAPENDSQTTVPLWLRAVRQTKRLLAKGFGQENESVAR